MTLEPAPENKSIASRIEQAQAVGISLADRSEASLKTGFLLWYGFKKLGKKVSFEYPGSSQDKTFQITLRGIAPWISSVRYEKNDKDLNLLFTLSNGEFSEEDILLKPRAASGDLSLIVGEEDGFHNQAKEAASVLLDRFFGSEKASLQLASLLFAKLQPESRDTFGIALPKGTPLPSSVKDLGLAVEHLALCLGDSKTYLVCFREEGSFSTRCLLRTPDSARKNTLRTLLSQSEERGRWLLGTAGVQAPEETLSSLLSSLA